MNLDQKTIKKKLVLEGIALHSGALVKIALVPSEENTGITFLRTDLKKNSVIKACWKNLALENLTALKFLINMEETEFTILNLKIEIDYQFVN